MAHPGLLGLRRVGDHHGGARRLVRWRLLAEHPDILTDDSKQIGTAAEAADADREGEARGSTALWMSVEVTGCARGFEYFSERLGSDAVRFA